MGARAAGAFAVAFAGAALVDGVAGADTSGIGNGAS